MKKQIRKQLKKVLSVVMAVTLLVLSVSVGFTVSVAADETTTAPHELITDHRYEFLDSEGMIIESHTQGLYIDGLNWWYYKGGALRSPESVYEEYLDDLYRDRVCGWCLFETVDDPDEAGDKILVGKGKDAVNTQGSVYRLNHGGKFAFVKPSTSYVVNIRYRVVANHTTIEGRDYYHSVLKLGYGSGIEVPDVTYKGQGENTLLTPVATLAYTSNDVTTFTSTDEYGNSQEKDFGNWYEETYNFTTPAEFPADPLTGERSQHLALFASYPPGFEYHIDFIDIHETISEHRFEFKDTENVVANRTQGLFIDGTDNWNYAGGNGTTSYETHPEGYYFDRVAGYCTFATESDTEEEGDNLLVARSVHPSMNLGSVYRLNYDGRFALLRPNTGYTVTIRYRFVNNHTTQTGQQTILQLGYGSTVDKTRNDEVYRNQGPDTMSTVVATMIKGTDSSTSSFTSINENGVTSQKNYGQWYEETYHFATLEKFPVDEFYGRRSQHLVLYSIMGVGAVYEIDYIGIKESSIVKADLRGGNGTNAISGKAGDLINIPTPTRDGYDFVDWYTDIDYTTKFSQTHFNSDNEIINVYAKWKPSYATRKVDFFEYPLDQFGEEVMKGGAGGYFYLGQNGKALGYRNNDGYIDASNPVYIPLCTDVTATDDGRIRLKSNTDYIISFNYTMATYNGKSAKANVSFFTASPDNADDGKFTVPKSNTTLAYAWDYTDQYIHVTTGEIEEGKDALYFNISAKDTILYNIYFGYFKIFEVDSNTGFYFAKDTLNDKTYQIVGEVGETLNLPDLGETIFYQQGGWFNDEKFTTRTGNIIEQGVHTVYMRWEHVPLDFENYFHNDKMYQVHTFGEDFAINAGGEGHGNVLEYNFEYVPNYLKSTSNAVSLAVVNNGVTYEITYDYKVEEANGDIDVEFFTAHRNARWTFLNKYNTSVNTIRKSEAGKGWKTATVYLTADLACHGGETYDNVGDGLFIGVNPQVLETANVLFDNITITPLEANEGVVVFLDKNSNSFKTVKGAVGNSVSKNDVGAVPCDYMSQFTGWYSDAKKETAFESTQITAGVTVVYSDFTEGIANFDGNLYADNNIVDGKFAPSTTATTQIGELKDNTTYLITYDYTAGENAFISFFTADANDKTVNASDAEEFKFALNGKALFSTGFACTNEVYGNNLYVTLSGGSTLDNLTITEAPVLSAQGNAVLVDQEAEKANHQAIRYFFGYESENSVDVVIGGETYTVTERGVAIKNANNVVEGETVYPASVKKAQDGEFGYTYKGKTYGFKNCWEYKDGEVVFSNYVKGFGLTDGRLTSARGYLVLSDAAGNEFTVYSAPELTSVKDTKAVLAEYTNTDKHIINGTNWNRYSIVHPRIMSYIYGEKIEELVAFAKERSVSLPSLTDLSAEKQQEIVIGDTTRAVSAQVTVTEENAYIIKVIDGKVVIKGGSDIATRQALTDFMAFIERKEELGCGMDLNNGFVMTGEYNAVDSDYALTFGDEFNGDFNSYWYGNAGDSGSYQASAIEGRYVTSRGIGGSEVKLKKSRETKELVRLEDGSAVLGTAYIEPTTQKDIDKKASFAESQLSTIGKMLYQYGMLEFKVKLAGQPTTNSLWVNGEVGDNSGPYKRGCFTEYDMLENFGNRNSYGSNLHYWWQANREGEETHIDLVTQKLMTKHRLDYYPIEGENYMTDDYHIFTLVWTDEGVKFAFDGVSYCTYTSPDWYKEAMPNYIIISSGIGDASYGPKYDVENDPEYQESLIDYVRLYQIKDMGAFIYDVENNRKY